VALPARLVPVQAGQADPGRRRPGAAEPPGRHRRELVVPALPLGRRVDPDRGPSGPGPHLRPPGTGDRPGHRVGLVVAQVQGSRRTPYGVQISMPAASDARWEAIVDALAAQAGYAARLLAGELPHEIEDVFAGAGVALFPERGSHLTTSCTCPDWATPCKHAAAVCYLMAEAFDDDPFLLLAFRGREREALLDELRDRRGVAVDDGADPGGRRGAELFPHPSRRRAPRRWRTPSPPSGAAAPGWPRCTASPGPPKPPGRCCACCRGACSSCGARRSPICWSPPTPGSPPTPRGGPSEAVRPSKSGAKNPRDPAHTPVTVIPAGLLLSVLRSPGRAAPGRSRVPRRRRNGRPA
jgi:hypothetical protein